MAGTYKAALHYADGDIEELLPPCYARLYCHIRHTMLIRLQGHIRMARVEAILRCCYADMRSVTLRYAMKAAGSICYIHMIRTTRPTPHRMNIIFRSPSMAHYSSSLYNNRMSSVQSQLQGRCRYNIATLRDIIDIAISHTPAHATPIRYAIAAATSLPLR